jgi:hypothetical protein
VRLWAALEDDRPLTTLQGNTGAVLGEVFSTDERRMASGGDGMVKPWQVRNFLLQYTLRPDRRYERMDISGLTGVTEAQRAALFALGAIEQAPASSSAPAKAH